MRTGTSPLTDTQRATLQDMHDRIDAVLEIPVGLVLRDETVRELRKVRDSLRDRLRPSVFDSDDWL